MPNLYMGRGGLDGLFGPPKSGGSVGPVNAGNFTQNDGLNKPTLPGLRSDPGSVGPISAPGTITPQLPSSNTAPAPNVVQPGAVRATGDGKGYDSSYLQNLATSIGALFARPNGNISFNPLGNLSEVSPPSGISGTAPGTGEPLTWLQQALNGLGFSWGSPAATAPNISSIGGDGNNGGRRVGAINTL